MSYEIKVIKEVKINFSESELEVILAILASSKYQSYTDYMLRHKLSISNNKYILTDLFERIDKINTALKER